MTTKPEPIITFEKILFEKVIFALDIKDPVCIVCGKKITKDNVGGITYGGKDVFCNDESCVILYLLRRLR